MLNSNLSFQLYSARNTPLPEALEIVAQAGYRTVEAYGDNFSDLAAFQRGLKQNNLRVSSIHIGRDDLKNNMIGTLELASELEANLIVCPYLLPEDRPSDQAGWIALAEELSDYNSQITSTGRDFAWHNHDFEFQRTQDGALPIRLLLDNAPGMQWEIDLGWIQRASQDPASWLRTYLDRVSAVHIKDVAMSGESDDEDGWADVGYGVIEWSDILPELKRCEAEIFVVEHDNPSDLKRFAERSFKTVNGWE